MINKNSLQFLENLKQNNNREWFAENKEWYERAKADFELLVAKMIQALAPFDSEAAHREAKKCVFRIYRDVRFSPDKSPYKTNMGASMGSKDHGYYMQIAPEESFIACGYYMPQPHELKKIRRGIYEDFETFKEIIDNKTFKNNIGDLRRDGDSLKRVPNGFDKEHPAAEYIKLKRFYVMKTIGQEQLLKDDFVQYAAQMYEAMYPLKKFLVDLLED
ncbi:TIGR02453 family protein [Bacteroidales bacterium]|nr:TIGR02453 family protein [Bacteroidales bacterium]